MSDNTEYDLKYATMVLGEALAKAGDPPVTFPHTDLHDGLTIKLDNEQLHAFAKFIANPETPCFKVEQITLVKAAGYAYPGVEFVVTGTNGETKKLWVLGEMPERTT